MGKVLVACEFSGTVRDRARRACQRRALTWIHRGKSEMDISSKRFSVKTAHHVATIRDRNAPYHCHTIPAADLPSVEHMAQINESQFDSEISALIYGDSNV